MTLSCITLHYILYYECEMNGLSSLARHYSTIEWISISQRCWFLWWVDVDSSVVTQSFIFQTNKTELDKRILWDQHNFSSLLHNSWDWVITLHCIALHCFGSNKGIVIVLFWWNNEWINCLIIMKQRK
jgi:hypothetical protein